MHRAVRCTGRTVLAALIAMMLAPLALGAADGGQFLFQWTDDSGTVHITDSLDKVPLPYRSRTQSLRQSETSGSGQEQNVQQAPARGGDAGRDAAEAEADQKEAWQRRMQDAKGRLDDAESRLVALEQQKQNIMSQWGSSGATLPPQQVLDQMKQIDSDVERTKREIGSIRHEINEVIPDEARKAGIPPGWLRDVQ